MFCGNMKPIRDGGVWGPDDLAEDWVIRFPGFIQPRRLALRCFTCVSITQLVGSPSSPINILLALMVRGQSWHLGVLPTKIECLN